VLSHIPAPNALFPAPPQPAQGALRHCPGNRHSLRQNEFDTLLQQKYRRKIIKVDDYDVYEKQFSLTARASKKQFPIIFIRKFRMRHQCWRRKSSDSIPDQKVAIIQIATNILRGRCDAVIFSVDTMHAHTYPDDIRVVFAACMARPWVRMITNALQAREWIDRVVRHAHDTPISAS
jgi:hypothetical protein